MLRDLFIDYGLATADPEEHFRSLAPIVYDFVMIA